MEEHELQVGHDDVNIDLPKSKCDWILQDLALMANHGLQIPIKLATPGGVISGVMISGAAYVDSIIKGTKDGSSSEMAEMLEGWFTSWKEVYTSADKDDPDQPSPAPNYIHLENARVYTGNSPIPSNQGVYWRVRIDTVSGFSLGALTSPER